MRKLLSVVIPAYNEAGNLREVTRRIECVLSKLNYNYEIIIIDDGSKDKTLEELKELSLMDEHLYYIEFSRNFGHQSALQAGIDAAKGDCVISLDCDLQHPPEMFKQMLEKWEEGYEVVYTRRQEDPSLPYMKRKSSTAFYRIINVLSDIEIEPGTADFRLLDRKAAEALKGLKEADPFFRGLVKWLGFRQYAIDYIPDRRFSGASKYSIKKMRKFALIGVTSLTTKPLHFAVYLGFFFALASIAYVPYVIYSFMAGVEVLGWASLIVTIAFFGGLQLIILGIIGIYIGKMFMQTKERPNYIIRSSNLIK